MNCATRTWTPAPTTLLLTAAFWSLTLLAGCPSTGDGPISFQPQPIVAPEARPYFTTTTEAALVNNTGAIWQISGLTVSGQDDDQAAAFRVSFADPLVESPVLGPGESVALRVEFSPILLGEYAATLTAITRMRDYSIGGGGCSAGCGAEAPSDTEFLASTAVRGTADADAAFEDCTDNEDNDSDDLIDCDDPDCFSHPACAEDTEDCEDGVDNDGDGLIDCDDPDCGNDPDCGVIVGCEPGGEITCGSTISDTTNGAPNSWTDYCESNQDGWTGGEDIFSFRPEQSGVVDIQAFAPDWDLDLTILEGTINEAGEIVCSPERCVATSWNPPGGPEVVSFEAQAGTLYFVVIDGWGEGPFARGPYELRLQCAAGGIELDCADGLDNDNDGRTDCGDPDCFGSPDCGGGACQPVGPATCNSPINANTGDMTATNNVVDWCGEGFDGWTGPEMAWLYTPNSTGTVRVDVGALSADLDLVVLLVPPNLPPDQACNPEICVEQSFSPGNQPESVVFDAFAGTEYIIAVDGWNGASSTLRMLLTCGGGEICDDGADNDADGQVDCDDSDCVGDPSCLGFEDCFNGLDDDGDGQIDCDDVIDCQAAPGCDYGSGDCCVDNGTPGCENDLGEDCVCAADPFCCEVTWDAVCADLYLNQCGGACGGLAETACADGADNDNDGLIDCADADCNADPNCQGPQFEFSCVNGVDDDTDGQIDCLDLDCAAHPACVQPGIEQCSNGLDDDADGQIDCADLDCFADPSCDAGDGDCCIDNGGPGCDDELGEDCVCAADPFCCQVTWDSICADAYQNQCGGVCNGLEQCNNGADDDGDGLIDCADTDCASDPNCAPAGTETQCADGIDNDADGAIDCDDGDCTFAPVCDAGDGDCCTANGTPGCDDEPGEDCVCAADPFCCNNQWDAICANAYQTTCGGTCTGVEQCDNGLDDDGDGLLDCLDVADCSGAPNCQPPPNESNCTNGLDDDQDGLIDCDDPNCVLNPACNIPPVEISCVNGVDDDQDGATDCADSDCAGFPGCVNPPETNCVNGIDDDADGLTDCNDSNCQFHPACANNETSCTNGVDDDGDGLVDCNDGDCSADIACVPSGACNPLANVQCGDVITGSNTMSGSTNTQDIYCGYNPGGWSGREVSWLFTPQDTGFVDVTLTGLTADLDIQALTQDAGGCDVNDCEANGWNPPPQPEQMDWFAFAGVPYYILVDGWQGASSSFTMTITCTPLNESDCDDGVDDDQDGATDCADVDCLGTAACPELDCSNGIDDDADAATDCNDVDCFGTLECIPEFLCTNGLDDDADGLADCDDTDCDLDPACFVAGPETLCANGVDDDADGFVDCSDADCVGTPGCGSTAEICGDGFDNDNDGDRDCFDSDCVGSAFCSGGETICDNNFDDDADGLADCFDADCFGAAGCPLVLFSSVDDDPADFNYVPLGQNASSVVWEQGTPNTAMQSGSGPSAAFEGTLAWCTGCSQSVESNGRFQAYLVAQPTTFDLSTLSGGTLILSFRHWQVSPGVPFIDLSRVDASSNSGTNVQTVWGPSTASTNGWSPVSIDLSSYLGGNLTFAFRYDTLFSFGGGQTADGWTIDNVELIWTP